MVKLLIVAIGCLVGGFLLGVCLDAKYRPNTITLYLEDNAKLSVKPRYGDLINWVSYDSASNPQTYFLFNQAPCGPNSTASACWYDPTNTTTEVALYGCSLNGKKGSCTDPGVGPKSGTGGVGGRGGFSLRAFFTILEIDFVRLFGLWPELSAGRLSALGVSGPSGTRTIEPSVAPATLPAAVVNQTIQVGVGCMNNAPAVLNPRTGDPIDPIPAQAGDTISWTPYASYTISGLTICSNNSVSSGGNQNCNVLSDTKPGSYAYQLSVQNCGSGPATFHIQIH